MEGFNQEFKLAMEEVQELTRRSAMYSSRENNGKLEKNKFLTFPFGKRRKEMLM